MKMQVLDDEVVIEGTAEEWKDWENARLRTMNIGRRDSLPIRKIVVLR